ncbi:MAG TPA: GNAT family N-acetyltransferase [Chitinophagaceae bacterium]|nr:GNAT family N-acetyltransferase [Chitinophagaceae bacterium]
MITPQFIFETERLAVRQYNAQDDDLFYQLSSNEEVMRYIRPTVSKEDSDKLLVQNIHLYLSRANTGRWAMFERHTGNFVGSFSILAMDSDNAKLHIGYALLPQFWGRGYATEILRGGIGFFFRYHSSNTLYAIAEERNTASQKVLQKCGFTYQNSQMEKEKILLLFTLQRNFLTPHE